MVVDGAPGDGHVLVPFTGSDHDWSAVEIAAWLARTLGIPLTVAGPAGPGNPGRMLASASLAVQRALDIAASPLLIQAGGNGLMEAARNAAAVVAGLSDRWQTDGLGITRAALAAQARPPIVFVRRGLRPGGLAPRESRTRFTWSIAPAT
jgi:hypothetical protein